MGNNSLYCKLNTTSTAAISVKYTSQCIMGNYTVVTRNAPSRQFNNSAILKAVQNIRTFQRTVPTACHVTPQNIFFVLLKRTAFRPALLWPDTVANQGSICGRLRAPLDRRLPQTFNSSNAACQLTDRQT